MSQASSSVANNFDLAGDENFAPPGPPKWVWIAGLAALVILGLVLLKKKAN